MFLAVLIVGGYAGQGPALVATVLGAFASARFLIPPKDSFAVHRFEDRAGLILYLVIGVGIALLGFFWGLAMFIFSAGAGDEGKRAEARSIMIYGVIALFVMVSVWGLVGFLGNTVGITPGQTSGTIPSVQGL